MKHLLLTMIAICTICSCVEDPKYNDYKKQNVANTNKVKSSNVAKKRKGGLPDDFDISKAIICPGVVGSEVVGRSGNTIILNDDNNPYIKSITILSNNLNGIPNPKYITTSELRRIKKEALIETFNNMSNSDLNIEIDKLNDNIADIEREIRDMNSQMEFDRLGNFSK